MEMRVKAQVHAASLGPINGVRKELRDPQPRELLQRRELRDLQPEPRPESRRSPSSPRDPSLHLEERVPAVIGLQSQDHLQHNVPLDDRMCPLEGLRCCRLDASSPLEVLAVALPGASGAFSGDDSHVDQDPVVGLVDSSVNNLLIGTPGVMLQSPRGGHDDAPPLSPLIIPVQNDPIQSGLSGPDLHRAESVRCHLNFNPNSAAGVGRVYDSAQSSGPMVVTSLAEARC